MGTFKAGVIKVGSYGRQRNTVHPRDIIPSVLHTVNTDKGYVWGVLNSVAVFDNLLRIEKLKPNSPVRFYFILESELFRRILT